MRICARCGQEQAVAPGEPLWPLGWRCEGCGWQVGAAGAVALLKPELADTATGYSGHLFEFHAVHEASHFWFSPRRDLIVWALRHFFPNARSFMEIGCGNGPVLAAIAQMRPDLALFGAELHPKGLERASQRLGTRAQFVQMDAREINLRDEIDVIGAFDVIEHIAEDERVLEQMYKAVRPGGGILVAVPQHPFLWSESDERLFHQRRYERGEMERKMRAAGFDVIWSTSYTSLLFPAMAASRLLARPAGAGSGAGAGTGAAGAGQEDGLSEREFDVAPWLNRILKGIQDLEVKLTKSGMRWPVGGSRFVAGVKPASN
ncbi:MAG TPA: class I SAM-dependent methyltransferase [Hyphomicrobiales bacterium]|nr:class I SAM-dependent methyltransferase [Hyphomicrobiales bacterium]